MWVGRYKVGTCTALPDEIRCLFRPHKKKKKCLVSGNMKRFSWVGRSDYFFFFDK